MDAKNLGREFAFPIFLLIIFVIALFAVFNLTKNITKPPFITLTSSNDIVTDQTSVPVTGTVKNTSALSVNNQKVTVGKDGSFSTTTPVNIGDNTINVVAGSSTKVTQTVKVMREEIAKAITATNSESGGSNLTTSGPTENVMGSFGFAAIIVSLVIYRKSKRNNPLQKAISQV